MRFNEFKPLLEARTWADDYEDEYGWRAHLVKHVSLYDFIFKYTNRETGQTLNYLVRPQGMGYSGYWFLDSADVKNLETGRLGQWLSGFNQDPTTSDKLFSVTYAFFEDHPKLLNAIGDELKRLASEFEGPRDQFTGFPPNLPGLKPAYHAHVNASDFVNDLDAVDDIAAKSKDLPDVTNIINKAKHSSSQELKNKPK